VQNSHWNVTVLLTEVPLSAPAGNPTTLVRSWIRTVGRWERRGRKVRTSADRSGKSGSSYHSPSVPFRSMLTKVYMW
jgi:hypothetical protein